MNRWRIYYADGSTYSERDGALEDAPAWGVLVIAEVNLTDGRHTVSNGDYYVWDDRGAGPHWWECNETGLLLYLSKPGWKKVLFGELVENETFQAAHLRAVQDGEVGE